jgi:hypothetical protein
MLITLSPSTRALTQLKIVVSIRQTRVKYFFNDPSEKTAAYTQDDRIAKMKAWYKGLADHLKEGTWYTFENVQVGVDADGQELILTYSVRSDDEAKKTIRKFKYPFCSEQSSDLIDMGSHRESLSNGWFIKQAESWGDRAAGGEATSHRCLVASQGARHIRSASTTYHRSL